MLFISSHWYIWAAVAVIGLIYATVAFAGLHQSMETPHAPPEHNPWFPFARKSDAIETLIAFGFGFMGIVLLVLSAVKNFAGFLLQV